MRLLPHRLHCLAAIHIAASLLTSCLAAQSIGAPWTGLVSDTLLAAQLGLLGIWAGLGDHSKLAGFSGVAAGAMSFSLLAFAEVWPEVSTVGGMDGWVALWYLMFSLALAMMALSVILAAAISLRLRGIALRQIEEAAHAQDTEALQFSMRQLMLLVLVVAVLVKLGPTVQTRLNDYNSSLAMLSAVVCWGLCFGIVALAGLAATLSVRLSAERLLTATALAGGLSLLPPYYFPELLTNDFAASAAVLVGAAWVLIGSLLVVRSCGYRLTPRLATAPTKVAGIESVA